MDKVNKPELMRAVYISDIIVDDFEKGTECLVFRINGVPNMLGYIDKYGEEYALPATRFKLIE